MEKRGRKREKNGGIIETVGEREARENHSELDQGQKREREKHSRGN